MAKSPRWQGKRVVHESHIQDLEHRAALHEFESGHPRSEAERLAYEDYRRDHHRQAAAHHLRGMRAAQGSGDMDESRKHGIAYGLHMKALGLDPMDEVPAEIKAMVDGEDRQPHYKFKTHKGDSLLLQDHEESVQKAELEKGDVIQGRFPQAPKSPEAPSAPQGPAATVTPIPKPPQATSRKQMQEQAIHSLRAHYPPPKDHGHTWASVIEHVGNVLGGECGARALDDEEDFEETKSALADHFGVHPDVIHDELVNHESRCMDDDEDLGATTRGVAQHLRQYFGLSKPSLPRKKR